MSVDDGRGRDAVATLGRGMQPTDVRHANQRALLTILAVEPGLSNAELARRSALAPQTVSSVLEHLEAAQLVVRGEVRRGRRGQPATPFQLNPLGAFAIGAEIGWRHLEVDLIGFGGQVIRRYRRDYDYPDATEVFAELGRAAAEVTADLAPEERTRLAGLGVAAPLGIGDPTWLLEAPAGSVALWSEIDIEATAAAATGLPVLFSNDGNAACWAELVALPVPRPQSFAFLLIDTFVAAGIVAANRLWEGRTGVSANLGSMLVTDRLGVPRFVHQIASLHALERRLAAVGAGLGELAAEALTPATAMVCDEWIEDASFAIAQTFLNTAAVLEYQVAIVEGALPASMLERLVAATQRQIGEIPSFGRQRPPVIAGHLGSSGAARGAAQLLLYRRYFSRNLEHMAA